MMTSWKFKAEGKRHRCIILTGILAYFRKFHRLLDFDGHNKDELKLPLNWFFLFVSIELDLEIVKFLFINHSMQA